MCDDGHRGHALAMTDTARFRRVAAATGLLLAPLLMAVATVLAPEFSSDQAERLAGLEAGGLPATVSTLAFTLAQLPFLAAVLGVGHLLRGRAPRLSNIGTTLAVVGVFGHSVHGGVNLLTLDMAADPTNRETYAGVLTELEQGPAIAFMAMGLVGTVLGVLLLAVGLWRAQVGPRWVAPVLWAFLVVEFAGGGISDWAFQLSTALFLLGFGALGVAVWRMDEAAWEASARPAADTVPSATTSAEHGSPSPASS
jgi:hypothetical protein